MFSRTFSIVMTPALALTALLAGILYFGNLVFQLVNGEVAAAVLWFLLWGHILSGIVAALVVFPVLAVLGVLAACVVWLFGLGWRLQKRGVESLPFRVERKDTTTPLTEEEEGIKQMLAQARRDAWREH